FDVSSNINTPPSPLGLQLSSHSALHYGSRYYF
ncbi:MAG: hypothetical protein ACJA2O_004576, partial [Candidatus Azotimanducaceae bacterium]